MNKKVFGLVLSLFSVNCLSYVECVTKVKEIQPHIDGGVFFKFQDGSSLYAPKEREGLDRNFSVALAAQATRNDVKLLISDGRTCGTNVGENWGYIVSISP